MEEKKDESSSSSSSSDLVGKNHSETASTTISVLAAACNSSSSGGRRKKEKAGAMDILDSLTTIRSTRTRRGGGSSTAAAAAAATKKGPSISTKIAPPLENSLSLLVAATTTTAPAPAPAPSIKKHPALQRGGRGKKNVKQLLRRRGSTASAASSAEAVETAFPVQQQQQQQHRHRQTSTASATAVNQQQQQQRQQQQNQLQRRKQRKLPVIIVESDENPRRLVNPLTEWPPSCSAVLASSVVPTAGATAASASSGTTAPSPTAAAAGISPHSTASAGSNAQACELWPLQDIFHPLPDTYSIAYMARLLGFQLPPPPVAPNSLTNNISYKPVPLPANLELERDDGYLAIPRLGTFVDAVYKNGKRHVHGAATQDADDCRTLDLLDPLYEALLLHSDDDHDNDHDGISNNNNNKAEGTTTTNTTRRPSLCSLLSSSLLAMTKPVTAAHQQRLLQAGTFGAAWSDTLQLARTYMITADDDDENNATGPAATMTNSSMNDSNSGPSTSISSSSSWKVSTLADFQREQQQRQEQQQEQNPNPSLPPVPLTSRRLPEFLTSFKKPVANECGIFLWKDITPTNNTNNNDSSNTSAAAAATDTEVLVGVVMYQFVWYCHGNNQAGVVLSIRDICNAHGVSCLDESNYTVVDVNQQEQEKHQENAATTAPLSMSQLLRLTSLVLQHARAAQVWYATLLVPGRLQGFFATFFRMVPSAKSVSSSSSSSPTTMVRMVCDLNKCSTRYAFLMYQQFKGGLRSNVLDMIPPKEDEAVTTTTTPFRALVRLPNVDEVRVALKPPTMVAPIRSNSKRTASNIGTNNVYFTSASSRMRQVAVGIRAQFSQKAAAEYNDDNSDDDDARDGHEQDDVGRELQECSLFKLDPVSRQVGDPIDLPPFYAEQSLDILKTFPLVQSLLTNETDAEDSDLLQKLVAKQQQVTALETGIEPSLRRLLNMVVEERIEYESAHAIAKRNAERRVLEENRQMLERRRAKDLEEQERLENDMDAVCSICLDGEVTPSNQILFCDTCNVAVHQYCYGIDRVPEGDYFCLACREDKEQPTIDGAAAALATATHGASNMSPRAIVCELCPLTNGAGAFIQTQYVPQDTEDEATTARKWVHVVCAKWLGLNFVDNDRPNLVEDVTDLKRAFRVNNIKCELCQGERGSMNKCRHENCEKWLHVTCARASKTCEVVHGEDCHGDVEQNPWTLTCPEHSEIPAEDVPKDAISITELVEMAKALPPEPAPLPAKIIPFNKAKGHERKRLLADPEYERQLLIELTIKITATHFVGVRCQVCDQLFDVNTTGKDLTKCSVCLVYFCPTCKLDVDDDVAGNYKCPSCQFVVKSNIGEQRRPSCVACYCKNGPLRPGVAKPVKMTHWNKHPKEFERSLYAKNKLWVHSLCAFWNSQLFFSANKPGHVDFSDVVMSHGRTFVTASTKCAVCGLSGGLKVKCDVRGCMCIEGESGNHIPSYFHPTCARQAGFEVSSEDDEDGARCFIRCYRHSGNENNLRAKLEDLIEIERIRSGKTMRNADKIMTFSDASRLLHSSIVVMRILGWSWRWAEWWVDYNSSWEPLLEEGEREDKMTKEQLKIVDSTRESRCRDARMCRLAALGAALRNRMYDRPTGGFDRRALDRALRAVLHSPSLVGPLQHNEIEFFVEWLGRAYRSRSVLLQLGENKNDVANDGVCVHLKDKSPKYELGSRPVPGKRILGGREVFEKNVEEVDDFMLLEILRDDVESNMSTFRPSDTGSSESRSQPAVKRRGPGRPRKADTPSDSNNEKSEASPVRKRKRSKSRTPADGNAQEITTVRKRGRPPYRHLKQAVTATASAEIGFPKRRGRPPFKHNRKAQETESEEAKRSPEPRIRRRAGRPKSCERPPPPPLTNDDDAPRRSPRSQRSSSPNKEMDEADAGDKYGDEDQDTSLPVPPPRKRGPGRPPRQRPAVDDAAEGSKPTDSRVPNEVAGVVQSETNADTEDIPVSPPLKRRRGRPPYKHLLKSNQDVAEDSKPNDSDEPYEEAEIVQSEVKHDAQEQESSNSAEKSTSPSIAKDAAKEAPPTKETSETIVDSEDPPLPPPRKRRGRPPYKHLLKVNQDVAEGSKPNDSPEPNEEAQVEQSDVKHVTQQQQESSNAQKSTSQSIASVASKIPQKLAKSRDLASMSEQNQSEDHEDAQASSKQSRSFKIDELMNSSLSKPGGDTAAALPSPPHKQSEAVPSLYSMVKRRRAAGRSDGSSDATKPKSVEESDGTRDRKASSAKAESKPMDTELLATEGNEKASIGASLLIERDDSTRDEEDAVKESGKSKAAAKKDLESLGEAQAEDDDAQQNSESKAGRGSNARGRGRPKNTRRGRPKKSCVRDDEEEGEVEEESDD